MTKATILMCQTTCLCYGFLRDKLELTGTKYGCRYGIMWCLHGACWRPSCCAPVWCPFQRSQENPLRPSKVCQKTAIIRYKKLGLNIRYPSVVIVQAGQIMNAASFLATTPRPSSDDIDNAMQGNICRCGTYQRIKLAVADALTNWRRRYKMTTMQNKTSADFNQSRRVFLKKTSVIGGGFNARRDGCSPCYGAV